MKIDDQILRLLKSGDKQGLELLFKQFYTPLVVYASKFVDTTEEAEDLVQEVFINFWEGNKFSQIQKYIRAYLYNSVRNKCLNYKKQNDRIDIVGLDDHSETLFESFPDDEEFKERVSEIKREIDKLPEKTKEIFIAIFFHKMSYEEVATDLNVSKNTVKTTLSRAMKRLRGNLTPEAFTILLLLF